VASAGPYATLTPFDLLQDLPLRATHGFTSTHPQSSSLHGAVKAGSLSEIERELYLLPASRASIFNPLDHRELRSHCFHQCLCSPDYTSSQVRCIPSQPDRLVIQSIATLLLSQGEPTVWSSKVFGNPAELLTVFTSLACSLAEPPAAKGCQLGGDHHPILHAATYLLGFLLHQEAARHTCQHKIMQHYIEKNCSQFSYSCISQRSKTAKIKIIARL